MTDDEIALKLMRLYRELRSAGDGEVRLSVCQAIDGLVAQLKRRPAMPARPSWEMSLFAGQGDD